MKRRNGVLQGIYLIRNMVNNKQYVGSSSNIALRWRVHLCQLRGGYHDNSHLQYAWDKYGEGNFEFLVLEQTESLATKEQWWMDELDVCNKELGYNIRPFASSNRHSKETKAKISAALMGNKNGAGTFSGNGFAGHKHTAESRAKMSAALKGRILTKEWKAKISAANKGKRKGIPLTDEHRANISAAAKHRWAKQRELA